MARKKRTQEERTIDPAAQEMLILADELGISTAFSRADDMVACNIGGAGMCCKICSMGPCRLTKEGQTGVCGATIDTIQARNLIRAIAAGAAAHSDHGRGMAMTLKAVANGETEGYVKIHVKKGTGRILGATIVGSHAGDMISEITVAMQSGMGLGKLANVIHPYPTAADAIRQCGDAYNRARLTPTVKGIFHRLMAFKR